MENMRERVGEDGERRRRDDVLPEDQVAQRRRQEHDARDCEQEMSHRVQVAEPLPEFQPVPEQRVVQPEYLEHPARPSHALADMQDQPLGREPRRQRQPQIGGVPSRAMQLQRGVRVLGHRLHGEAADLLQRGAADHRAGAAEEGRVPEVVAGLHQAIEHVALGRHVLAGGEVPLKRIGRIEMVRRLDRRHPLLAHQPAHGHLQEGARRHVVAVEHADELAVRLAHRVVQVAGLGVRVVRPDDVAGAARHGEVAERFPAPVVQDVHLHPVGWPVHRQGRQNRGAHQRKILIVTGDVNIDARPFGGILGQRHRLAVQRPGDLHVAEHHDHHSVGLGEGQPGPQDALQKGVEFERVGDAPHDVAQRHRARQHDQEHGHATAREAVHQEENQDGDRPEQGLFSRGQRHGRNRPDRGHADQRGRGVQQAPGQAEPAVLAAEHPAQRGGHDAAQDGHGTGREGAAILAFPAASRAAMARATAPMSRAAREPGS